MPAPRNYTTGISADRTAAEIQKILAKYGASRVSIEYDGEHPAGMTFMLDTVHGPRHFTLPVDVEAMRSSMIRAYREGSMNSLGKARASSLDQARKVAWRVVKDWIDAQLTLVTSEMASLDQVMLAYLHVDERGRTLYDSYREREADLERRMLEA